MGQTDVEGNMDPGQWHRSPPLANGGRFIPHHGLTSSSIATTAPQRERSWEKFATERRTFHSVQSPNSQHEEGTLNVAGKVSSTNNCDNMLHKEEFRHDTQDSMFSRHKNNEHALEMHRTLSAPVHTGKHSDQPDVIYPFSRMDMAEKNPLEIQHASLPPDYVYQPKGENIYERNKGVWINQAQKVQGRDMYQAYYGEHGSYTHGQSLPMESSTWYHTSKHTDSQWKSSYAQHETYADYWNDMNARRRYGDKGQHQWPVYHNGRSVYEHGGSYPSTMPWTRESFSGQPRLYPRSYSDQNYWQTNQLTESGHHAAPPNGTHPHMPYNTPTQSPPHRSKTFHPATHPPYPHTTNPAKHEPYPTPTGPSPEKNKHGNGKGRRCLWSGPGGCNATEELHSTQWRRGPLGAGTLCNKHGLQHKYPVDRQRRNENRRLVYASRRRIVKLGAKGDMQKEVEVGKARGRAGRKQESSDTWSD